MSTLSPLERVSRLREETAKASEGTWTQDEWRIIEDGHEAEIAHLEGPWWVADGNGGHIDRWDPVAAGKVLDLLERLFTRHVWDKDSEWCRGCRCAQYPCPDLTDALAALDQLDGGSTT